MQCRGFLAVPYQMQAVCGRKLHVQKKKLPGCKWCVMAVLNLHPALAGLGGRWRVGRKARKRERERNGGGGGCAYTLGKVRAGLWEGRG